jgi:rhodanese-related sulfurtransferase
MTPMRRTALPLLAAVALGAAACAGARSEPPPGGAAAPAPKDVRVDGATAAALVQGGARLVDVRSAQEFAGGHLPGAVNVPYDEVEKHLAALGESGDAIVLYCRSGRRSAIAAQALERLGYRNVHDMGPMSAWPGEIQAAPGRAP